MEKEIRKDSEQDLLFQNKFLGRRINWRDLQNMLTSGVMSPRKSYYQMSFRFSLKVRYVLQN